MSCGSGCKNANKLNFLSSPSHVEQSRISGFSIVFMDFFICLSMFSCQLHCLFESTTQEYKNCTVTSFIPKTLYNVGSLAKRGKITIIGLTSSLDFQF